MPEFLEISCSFSFPSYFCISYLNLKKNKTSSQEERFTKNKIRILCSFLEFSVFGDFFNIFRKLKKSSFRKGKYLLGTMPRNISKYAKFKKRQTQLHFCWDKNLFEKTRAVKISKYLISIHFFSFLLESLFFVLTCSFWRF